MARVFGFGGNIVVTDIEVALGEGDNKTTFKGNALRESRYGSFWQIDVTEPVLPKETPEAEYAEEIVKAAAIYEGEVYTQRKLLEEAIKDAATRLTTKREEIAKAGAADPAPPAA